MMNKIVGLIILFLITTVLFSQNNVDYMVVMVQQKKAIRMATTVPALQDLANNFERISNAQSDQWHPLYYAAFCYVQMSYLTKNSSEIDNYLSQAQLFVDKALEIYPDESELFALQGLIYQSRLQIDKSEKVLEYLKLADESLRQAISFNPNNPRAFYLTGLNLLFSPTEIGGGAEVACPYFQEAIEKYADNIPEHVLAPSWGGEKNHNMYTKYCSDFE